MARFQSAPTSEIVKLCWTRAWLAHVTSDIASFQTFTHFTKHVETPAQVHLPLSTNVAKARHGHIIFPPTHFTTLSCSTSKPLLLQVAKPGFLIGAMVYSIYYPIANVGLWAREFLVRFAPFPLIRFFNRGIRAGALVTLAITPKPIDIRPSPCVTQVRHGSACKISPSQVPPFRNWSQTDLNDLE